MVPSKGSGAPNDRPTSRDGVSNAEHVALAAKLMNGFAERTGVTSELPQHRYLWTDAFAVGNFLGLGRSTGERRYVDVALRLVDHVHATLGRYAAGDRRRGFISGLPEREAALHPTAGGLRGGKDLPERGPDEPFDERLEWDRDGQYFHYLVQWMHALNEASRWTHRPELNRWAAELGVKAFDAFTYVPARTAVRRMYWKMSIDLRRPLVPSMGQHDPLDGYVSYLEVQTTARGLSQEPEPDLSRELVEYASMLRDRELTTSDPLGLGGLLIDAFRLTHLPRKAGPDHAGLVRRLLGAARSGLDEYSREDELRLPAEHRLAFRELGLCIGMHALEVMQESSAPDWREFFESSETRAEIARLIRFEALRDQIERFWMEPAHRESESWMEHRDIDDVMLATSLAPRGFLGL